MSPSMLLGSGLAVPPLVGIASAISAEVLFEWEFFVGKMNDKNDEPTISP